MLKVDMKSGYIAGSGSMEDIATDILYVICQVHGALAQKDEKAAGVFRRLMVAGITDPKMPTFNKLPSIAYVWTTPTKGGGDGQ